MNDELKPCPFCGSKSIHQEYTSILCPDCGCIGPDKHVKGECVDPYMVWNKRHFDLATERHELSDLLHECYRRFQSYEKSHVARPDHHIEFMKRVKTALGV